MVYTPEGPRAIADALLVNGSLTSLSLAFNGLGDNGAEAILMGLKESKSLATLNLSSYFGKKFGPKGAAALASAIAVMGSLTAADLRYNGLSESVMAKLRLRKAVFWRTAFGVGFDLKL